MSSMSNRTNLILSLCNQNKGKALKAVVEKKRKHKEEDLMLGSVQKKSSSSQVSQDNHEDLRLSSVVLNKENSFSQINHHNHEDLKKTNHYIEEWLSKIDTCSIKPREHLEGLKCGFNTVSYTEENPNAYSLKDELLTLNNFKNHASSTSNASSKTNRKSVEDNILEENEFSESVLIHPIKRKKCLSQPTSSDFQFPVLHSLTNEMSVVIPMQPAITIRSSNLNHEQRYLNEGDNIQCMTPTHENFEVLKCGTNRINILSNVLIRNSENNVKPMNGSKHGEDTPNTKQQDEDLVKLNSQGHASSTSYCKSMISESFIDDSDIDPTYFPSKSECSEESPQIEGRKAGICNSNSNFENHDVPFESIPIPRPSINNCAAQVSMDKDVDLDKPQKNVSSNGFDEYKVTVESVETIKKNNYADKLNYCFYCDKDVTHFVRHVLTWHSAETTVQKILSLPPKSKARREAVSCLRKKGNFVKNRANDSLRPVKRLNPNDGSQIDDFLPCSFCLGFYKRTSLYRHTKKCPENTEIRSKRQTAQSDGQTTLLLGNLLKCDQLLAKELFPRMRADKINLIARKDMLICQYGYSYMKGRKSKGNLDFVRQNIRRLAKLLDFSRQQKPEIKNFIDILKPSNFSLILKGVNHIARYNADADVYESPTLVMNFGTLLKKCCNLAYIYLTQIENTNDQRKDLKILRTLIESQWADEISAQAALNLNENKWNKRELLPLTSDLKKLSIFLQKNAEDAFKQLQLSEENYTAYNILKEVVYTQIILLNRRRPAEVAQLKIDKYNAITSNISDGNGCGSNEFENCLSETEKILLNSYSRIVIRGKRGRGVPILLSPDMKKHFDYFISIRNKFITDNKYVFHTSGQGCLDGTKTLYKYALKCGVDKPKSISATKLRKHLATITQLLQFSEKDLEQLSQFMGHTLKTHCQVYRLSDNIYQTAKVSKLLLLMSEGGVEQYKGKKLDDIDVDLTPVIEEENILNRTDCNEKDTEVNSNAVVVHARGGRKPVIRQTWTHKAKQIIANHFSGHIKHKRPPNQAEVQNLIDLHPKEFENRKWTSIKAVVFNMYTGKLKMSS